MIDSNPADVRVGPRQGRRSTPVRLAVLAAIAIAALLAMAISTAPAAAAPKVSWGYLTMDDGTELRYTLTLPSESGKWPALFHYDGYTAGTDQSPYPLWRKSVRRYAQVSVQARGTGCSAGRYHFFSPDWATDGKQVVDWIARQPWSSGKVGMIGLSLPGITQLMVASQRPKALAAIAPGKADADLYRGIGRLGGIFNFNWVTLYETNLPSLWNDSLEVAEAQGDAECAANLAGHPIEDSNSMIVGVGESPMIDDRFWERAFNPIDHIDRIDVPMLATNGYNDDSVGGLGPLDYFRKIPRENLWAILSNGYHDPVGAVDGTWENQQMPESSDRWQPLYSKFFDHFLYGKQNGWEKTPRVRINQNVSASGHAAWTDSYSTFPPRAAEPVALYTRRGGGLRRGPVSKRRSGSSSYRYPLASGDYGYARTGEVGSWAPAPDGGGALSFTTPVLERDVSVAGPASVDLWLKSSAPDTDLQVTVSEILPDSRERYIQRGWLRASNRALLKRPTSPIRPEHPFIGSKAENLPKGEASLVRVAVVPFAHVFQKGTRIRFTVDAPTGSISLDKLRYLETPALNTVLSRSHRASRIVLPVVPGKRAKAPIPGCDSVRGQPCRAAVGAQPGGSIDPDGFRSADPTAELCLKRARKNPDGRIRLRLGTAAPARVQVRSPALRGKATRRSNARRQVKVKVRLRRSRRGARKIPVILRSNDDYGNVEVTRTKLRLTSDGRTIRKRSCMG